MVWASWRKNQKEKEGRRTQNKNKQQTFGRNEQIHLKNSVLEKDKLTLKCLKTLCG